MIYDNNLDMNKVKSTKQKFLDIAEVIDAFRVIPRIILVALYTFYVWYIQWTTSWYFQLIDPGAWDTAFITGTVTALGTMITFFTNKYVETGRKWDKKSTE